MSGVPIIVEAGALRVLIVGGGPVAARKANQFVGSGAQVRIVSPAMCAEMESLVLQRGLEVERRPYEPDDIADAHLVIAATNDRNVNDAIARDADRDSRLVNVAGVGDDGTFASMAMHRRGGLTIGVSAGGVPAAAVRIRDAIAERFDSRYADALRDVVALRRRLIQSGESDQWRARAVELLDADFCDAVEGGMIAERIAEWP